MAKKRNRGTTKIKAAEKVVLPKPANDDQEGKFRPTPEREQHNAFRNTGTTSRTAMRVIPVIETMLRAGKLSQAEFDALNHYREQAHKAEDDCAQCCTIAPERMMGGDRSPSGNQIPAGVLLATPAIMECARLEREMGSLLDIARAVAVDDMTLTRWAIKTSGGREQNRGGRVEIVPRNPLAVDMARMELRFAAGRIRA